MLLISLFFKINYYSAILFQCHFEIEYAWMRQKLWF